MIKKKRFPELQRENVPYRVHSPEVIDMPKYPVMLVGEVWEKGKKEFGFFFFKRDHFGKIIAKHEYGKKTQYGWKIMHIIPPEKGGTDDVGNLLPVHWEYFEDNDEY